jgi:hypothetical protein
MISYPPAPWYLQGYAIQTLQLVDARLAQDWIPPELKIISILPGKTLGSIYVSRYETGSILAYNELIVVPAIVAYAGKVGGWISHIYVDQPESVAGGRHIWGLPKELADFTWTDNRVEIAQGDRDLCELRYEKNGFSHFPRWPVPFQASIFSRLETKVLKFSGQAQSSVGLLGGQVDVPLNSPFANLSLGQPWLTLEHLHLRLIVESPIIVGE